MITMKIVLLKVLALLIWILCAQSAKVRIGGIMRALDLTRKEAFLLAVDDINNSSSILPDTQLIPLVLESDNSLEVVRAVCHLVDESVIAVIGPSTSTQTKVAQSILGDLRIPHITPTATDPTLSITLAGQGLYPSLLKMIPPDSFQSRALSALLREFEWSAVAILTENSEYGRNGLLELQQIATRNDWTVVSVENFQTSTDSESIDVRYHLQAIKNQHVRVIVLHCISQYARPVLRQADELGMLRNGWAWLVTEGITNNGGRALADTYGHIPNYMQGLLGTLPSTDENDQFLFLRERLTKSLKSASDEPLITAARVYDAVLAVAQGLHMFLKEGNSLKPPSFPPNFCASELLQIWPQGELLFQYIKELKGVQGTLGHLTFSKYGFHTTIQYDIENLISQGFIKIGTWKLGNMSSELELSSKAVFPGNTLNPPVDSVYDLSNMSLRVVTVKDAPFVVDNPDYKPDDPNSLRYTGYCIDLLLRLQEMLSFRFTVSLRATYGRQDPQTGSWDGIVKELMENKADLGLGAFTISYERQQVISFTKPFFDLGLTILIPRYNSAVQKDVFAFLSPFEPLLWAVILVALCVTSLVLVICSNCTPEGIQRRRLLKDHRKHCAIRQEPNIAPMGIFHALWLGFSSLVNQSIDPGRLLFPTRITLAVWWISTTVLVSAYTAKLASVMTVERSDKEVSSLEELVHDSNMEYGCAENSSVVDFFEKHEMALYREAFQKMQKMNSFVASFHEGIRKVRSSFNVPRGTSGRFAFIGDSPILTFATEQEPCNIETTGRLFGAQNYGLGLQKNSPYEKHFSLGILSLREEGFFETLYRRWFAGICSSPGKGSTATNNRQLDIWSMIGVFYCLLIGIGVAAVMVVVDWVRYMCCTTKMTCKVKKSKDLCMNTCQCSSKRTKRKLMAVQNVKNEAGLTLYSDDFKIKGIKY